MRTDATSSAPSMWSAVRSALVADVLRGSGQLHQGVPLRVNGEIHGESMLPALWPGDVVEIESCSAKDVRRGEIVLAVREDRLVLHRLVTPCTTDGFLLRGDCVPGCDPQYPPEALLGRLVRRTDQRPGVSSAIPSAALSRALGMLFCHCGVARRLALKLHAWRMGSAGAYRNEFRNSESL